MEDIKMDRKIVLTFVGGTVVGLVTGVLATSAYWSKYWSKYHCNRADDEIDDMKLYYEKQNAELYSYFTGGEEVNPDKKEDKKETEETETADADSEEEEKKRKAAEIKEKLIRNYEQTTNYATMYKNKETADDAYDEDEENDPAESEHPEEDAVYDPENPADVAKDYTDDHAKNKHRKPVIISEESLGELPGYIEMETLFYYTGDDVVTDENDTPIDEPALLLGDCLDKYDFRDSKESLIFVRNFAMDTVYEVQKVDAAYSGDGE